jgi:hypothetical protein
MFVSCSCGCGKGGYKEGLRAYGEFANRKLDSDQIIDRC